MEETEMKNHVVLLEEQRKNQLNELEKETAQKKALMLSLLLFAILLVGLAVIYLIVTRKNHVLKSQKHEIEEKNNELTVQKEWLEMANNEIKLMNEDLASQKDLVDKKNKAITDSIVYAQRIQAAVCPPADFLKDLNLDYFLVYMPRDIVSGDFYWFYHEGDNVFAVAADCTGHGVPGAFLSMVGNTLLHEIVNIKHVFKPDVILTMLHTGIRLALNQSSEDSDSEDGMDMSLCTVDAKLHRFQFAGAKNNLYVVQGDKLKILKANYYSIGGRQLRPDMQIEFTCYDFMYDDNTSIYMFSDGYLDQFGGDNNEKFNTQRFREMILNNRNLPMEEQKDVLAKTMDKWKGNRQQIDDFLVLGVKLADLQ
jgi:serine phosphatase RsbU (regulator of sigma subunit)